MTDWFPLGIDCLTSNGSCFGAGWVLYWWWWWWGGTHYPYQRLVALHRATYLVSDHEERPSNFFYNTMPVIYVLILKLPFQEGGPIGLIQNGDMITIDVVKRRMDVELTEEQLAERRKKWSPPAFKSMQGVLYKVCWIEFLVPSDQHFFLLSSFFFSLISEEESFLYLSVHQACATCFERMCDRWMRKTKSSISDDIWVFTIGMHPCDSSRCRSCRPFCFILEKPMSWHQIFLRGWMLVA